MPLRLIHRFIDQLSELTGRMLAWLSLLMMVVLCLVVVLRYGFEVGSIGLQEAVTYLHASIFMLGAAYTLKHDGHVRVDIFYRNFSPRGKAWINSLGGIIFLLPLCTYIFFISWDFVMQSWQIREVSTEPGGIPAVFLLKTLIPIMAINLGLQALADILRSAMVLIEGDATDKKEAAHG
jgi:TRAP-type mannitol/chloroaromatic compound transport system permease small subunit